MLVITMKIGFGYLFFSDGVMTSGIGVGGILFPSDHLVSLEHSLVRASSNLV
jgi:hypothetical protein